MVFEIQADLSLAHEIDRVVDVTLARFGRIDLVVNAAALVKDAPFLDPPGSRRRWGAAAGEQPRAAPAHGQYLDEVLAGPPGGQPARNRNVVNVSSVSGLFIYPRSRPRRAYGASKAVMNFLSCQMASECRRFGVRSTWSRRPRSRSSVPTKRVAAAIVGLDRRRMNGRILVIAQTGSRYAPDSATVAERSKRLPRAGD